MTEQQGATEVPEREIEFRNRKIWVKMPRPEQILVWKRILVRLQATENWTGEQVMASLERLRNIVDSVILNQADIDWMDDQMLAGDLDLQQSADIIPLALSAFAQDDNRASRRVAKKAAPAKKAAARKRA